MKYYLILTLTLIYSSVVLGQSDIKFCEFEKDPMYAENVMEVLSGLNGDHDLGLTSIPVALTFLMKTDSASVYYEGLVEEIIDSLASHFMPGGLHFYLAEDPLFIYEDLVYDFQIDNNEEILYQAFQHNRIDIIVANSITYGTAQLCGIAKILPSTVIVRYNCIPSGTISHEIGHELGLIHTHDTASGVELVNGSNCETAGDLICDTPADPNRGEMVSSDCVWEGTYEDELGYDIDLVDINGDVYETDVSNIMSYYGAHGCRNDFSHLQSVLMTNSVFKKIISYGYETPKMEFVIYDRVDMCEEGYSLSARVANVDTSVDYQWDFDSDGIIDGVGVDAQYFYSDYGQYTIKLIMTYPDGRQYYRSKICVVDYSNESIVAPFLDDFNEDIEREYVQLIGESVYKWNLGIAGVAFEQIHFDENSTMIYRVDVGDLDQPVLVFDYKCDNSDIIGGDTLLIELITCDNEPIILFEEWGAGLDTNGDFVTINLPLLSGDFDIINLSFTTKGNSQGYVELQIDNLEVYENDISNTIELIDYELSVFPNPTWSSVEIKTNFTISKINLIDIYGNTIATHYESNKIDLSGLSEGIYFLKIFDGEKWMLSKILKLN